LKHAAIAPPHHRALCEYGNIEVERARQHACAGSTAVAVAQGQKIDQIIAGVVMAATAVIVMVGIVVVDNGRHRWHGLHRMMRKDFRASVSAQNQRSQRHQQPKRDEPQHRPAKNRGPLG
jgi:hypothetical protein